MGRKTCNKSVKELNVNVVIFYFFNKKQLRENAVLQVEGMQVSVTTPLLRQACNDDIHVRVLFFSVAEGKDKNTNCYRADPAKWRIASSRS